MSNVPKVFSLMNFFINLCFNQYFDFYELFRIENLLIT